MTGRFRRHLRFFLAFALGAGVGLGTRALPVPEVYSFLAGVNAFFVLYIALMLRLASTLTPRRPWPPCRRG